MKSLYLITALTYATGLKAQTFSNMPFSTPQASNPAFTALSDLPQLNVYGKTGPLFRTIYAGYHQDAPKLNGIMGMYYSGFRSNHKGLTALNKNNLGLSYARLFRLNDKWQYSLGAGLELSAGGSHFNGTTTVWVDMGINLGGMLYTDQFFTALNLGTSVDAGGQLAWRTGYKWQPFGNKDISITPILTTNWIWGRMYLEGNLNLGYKKLNLNLGRNYNGFNAGIGYDFNRLRINYSVSNMFEIDNQELYHELGIQLKFAKPSDQKPRFNHRLF